MFVDDKILERLKKIATPTLANALDDFGFEGVTVSYTHLTLPTILLV